MALKDLRRGTTFSIEMSSDSKCILSENSVWAKNLIEFLLGTSNLDEIWKRLLYLHLLTNSTLGEEFEIQCRNFLTWIEINSNFFCFD
jgi:hypothetical protein